MGTPADGAAGSGRSGLTVLVLGCDGSWPGPGGAGSGYLVRSPGAAVLLDAGPGVLANLQRLADPAALTAVVVSHAHPDHWSDLPVLATYARLALGRRELPVLAPADVPPRVPLGSSSPVVWDVVGDGDRRAVGDQVLTFSETDHPGTTLAVRVDGAGRAMGYSADSGPGWGLDRLGPGLDLALCEATFTAADEGTAGHLSGRQAGDLARRAGVGTLVVTHRRPTCDAAAVRDEAAAAFGGPVGQAAIGEELTV